MAGHVLYGKRKLCSTEVADFVDIQGIGNDPLYKRFDSVYAVVKKNIEPQYQDFLAHPVYSDNDQVEWYVRDWVHTPVRYVDLSGAEKAKYTAIKEKTIAVYDGVRKRLTGEDKQILVGALKHIDEDFMFCYDDKVVVVAWGMSPDSHKHVVKGAVIHDLVIQSNYKVQFVVGENGTFSDKLFSGAVNRPDGFVLSHRDLPQVVSKKGFAFKGWEPDPLGMAVKGPLVFTAKYGEVPIEEEEAEAVKVHVTFWAGEGGSLSGTTACVVDKGGYLDASQIPTAVPDFGFSFAGWDVQPDHKQIDEDTTFYALFDRKSITCRFVAGEHGSIEGADHCSQPYGSAFNPDNVPVIRAKKGYRFTGWDKSPVGFVLNEDTTFTAQYERELPWYKRLWAWLTGKGCLKWLLWLLLFILLLLLLSWLLRGCDSSKGSTVEPSPKIETPSGEIIDDNGSVKDIVGEDGKLPGNNIVAPIVGDEGQKPPIISNPGTPDIVANRLNIYFEDANVNLEQFVTDLSQLYSTDQCQVIGMDRNVPMLQILIQEDMRDAIRESLNAQLPDYDFFIVDESIFTIVGNVSKEKANVGWHLEAIDVKEGWEITQGNPDVIVAVVDDGVDANHEILKGRIVSPYNVFTQDNRLSAGQGHGTHVAGLAVGSDKRFEEGVSGVAPKCKLMPVQVFDNGLCTFSSVTSGIMYAIHQGASVVNVSIGPNFRGLDVLPPQDQAYIARTQFKNEERVWKRIIRIANEHNAIIVFAAGNDNILANIPPENRTNQTLNVAAVDERVQGTDFTNYGKGANISAPGKGIASSVPVNEYAVFDGTSMAAPIVSGTVALMKSCKPEVSITEILPILQATGKRVSDYVPPMIQVDDALIALTTGVVPALSEGGNDGDMPAAPFDDSDRGDGQNPDDGGPGSDDGGPGSDDGGPGSDDDGQGSNGGGPGSDDDGQGSDEGGSGSDEGGPGLDEGGQGSDDGGTDYDAIRKLIEFYKRKISELEKMLPENK